ncbi:hypothetical protein UA45_05280 [Morganella morganii]|uniref:Uncharacterized protein n=1 Tax=Morganella morganii TaxID=582 RepID=A0A0D8LBP1_MORMO|nr:hypothetical protein UA45_05280 [Morganella morganii]
MLKKQANRLFLLPLKTPFAEKPGPDCGYLLFICEEQHITGTINRIAVTPAGNVTNGHPDMIYLAELCT